MSRVQIRLHKGDEVKYLSHLDLLRAFEFALRRAEIPVAYSEGFNPRPRMSFGSAIGVGVTSDDERIVLELASDMSPYEVMERLNAKLPKGFSVLVAEAVPDGVKSPISTLNASKFRVMLSCGEGCDCSVVQSTVRALLDSSEVKVNRVRDKGVKEIDIRPNLMDVHVTDCAGDRIAIEIGLKLGETGGARPQDFVQAISNQVSNLSIKGIHRLEQFHAAAQ